MCDWNEEELVEYTKWVEAARARARAKASSPSRGVALETVPRVAIEA